MIRMKTDSISLERIGLPGPFNPRDGRFSAAAARLFDEVLCSASYGAPEWDLRVAEFLDHRWEEMRGVLDCWPIGENLDCLCRELWDTATAFLAPMQFEEEEITAGGVRNKTVKVMQWALRNASPRAAAGFWSTNAAEALWNLQLKLDVGEVFQLETAHLKALSRVDYRFGELLDDQKDVALKAAASAFANAMNGSQNVATLLRHYLLSEGGRLHRSYRLFLEYLDTTAMRYLMSHCFDESFMTSGAWHRAYLVRRWVAEMLLPYGPR